MSLEAFVAGRYFNSFASIDTGISDNGIAIQQESRWETIEASDNYGDSIIDGVYRGGNFYLEYDCKAFKQGSMNPFWPWGGQGSIGGVAGNGFGVMQYYAPVAGGAGGLFPLGRLASTVSQPTVLTALQNTAYATPGALVVNTLTAAQSILAPNFPARLLFHTRLRQVPIRLLALPYENVVNTYILTRWATIT